MAAIALVPTRDREAVGMMLAGLDGAAQRRLQLAYARLVCRHPRKCGAQQCPERHRVVGNGVLGEIADTKPSGSDEASPVGLVDAGEDAHERRLSSAVSPDDPDLLAVPEHAGDALEHAARTVVPPDVREPQPFHTPALRHG